MYSCFMYTVVSPFPLCGLGSVRKKLNIVLHLHTQENGKKDTFLCVRNPFKTPLEKLNIYGGLAKTKVAWLYPWKENVHNSDFIAS